MAYLYRHIRLDKNEPFYIGIGSDEEGFYTRAYDKISRSSVWKRVINKTEYEVEIMLDNLTWEEVKFKEVEFIKLYGRKNLGLGPLYNLTDGGEGAKGAICSIETREKRRINATGRKQSVETVEKVRLSHLGSKRSAQAKLNISKSKQNKEFIKIATDNLKSPNRLTNLIKACNKKVLQYSLSGEFLKEWPSSTEILKNYKIGQPNLSLCCNGKQSTCGGYRWKFYTADYPLQLPDEELNKPVSVKNVPVFQYSLQGDFIKKWDSAELAVKSGELSIKTGSGISDCCRGKRKTAGGFKWSHTLI